MKKLRVKGETVRVLVGEQLRAARGGETGVQTDPSPSWVYSCVVSCTWTSDCTTSTTFVPSG